MSREDRIVSKLQGSYDFLEFVNDNYPHVISEWKSRIAGVDETPADTSDHLEDQSKCSKIF